MTGRARGRVVPPPPLVASRLEPPRYRYDLVRRERLLDALAAGAAHRLTLVSAPAGYGKTTLLAQWYQDARARGRRVGWISVDTIDDDPVRLLLYVMRVVQGLDPRAAQALGTLDGAALKPATAVATLANALAQLEDDVHIVLDDVHQARSPATLATLDALIAAAGPRAHLVLACREVPPLALAALRMRGELLELGPADLQFRDDEAVSYFALAPAAPIDGPQVLALNGKVDGWIAGLQLARLSLREAGDVERFVREFSGTHRDVYELFSDAVLMRQDAATRDFLLRTAVVNALSADLCDALTGRRDARRMLQRLEKSNFFLFPLDDRREVYRYHGLFRDFLLRKLDEDLPGLAPELHRRAALWYEAGGYPLRAADHGLRSGDEDFAGAMLDRVARRLFDSGGGAVLLRYAGQLPDAVLMRYPRQQLLRVYAYTLAWSFGRAEAVLGQVRRGLADQALCARWEAQGIDLDQLYADLAHREAQLALLQDDMPRAARLCEEWLETAARKPAFELAVTRTSLIYARREQFDLAGLDTAPAIRALFSADGQQWATVWHDTIIGSSHCEAGALARAEALFEGALATAIAVTGEASAVAALPALCLAELHYERGDVALAGGLVERYLPRADAEGLVEQLIAGWLTAARLALLDPARGAAAALALLDAGDEQAQRAGFARLRAHLAAERIRLALSAGDARHALRIGRALDLLGPPGRFAPAPGATSLTAARALAWALLACARGRPAEAVDLLVDWQGFARRRGCLRTALRAGVVLGRAWLAHGDDRRAQRALREALRLAAPGGFVRSFIDLGGPAVCELLAQSVGRDDEFGALRGRIVAAAGGAPAQAVAVAPVPAAPGAPAAVALCARERDVLHLAATGLMNSQIAAELGLTTGTVKWYMQQIFEKLQVHRRAQAVHRARLLGLVR